MSSRPAAALALLLASCAVPQVHAVTVETSTPAPRPPRVDVAPAPPTVVLQFTHSAPEGWTADYSFSAPVDAVAFVRTRIARDDWRLVEPNDGARVGAFVTAPHPFQRVRFELPTQTAQPESEYAPFIRFTDRGVLAYTGQLVVAQVVCSEGSCAGAPAKTLAKGDTLAGTLHLVAASGERVVVNGQTSVLEASIPITGDGTYAYFGDIVPVETPSSIRVFDRALPRWLEPLINADIPRVLALYTERLGPLEGAKPSVFLSFTALKSGYSFGGGVLPPHVVNVDLELGPDLLDEKNARTRAKIDELVAHEGAHFWNGGKFVHSGAAGAEWMHEGTADAMAFRALRLTGTFDEKAYRDRLSMAASECAMWLASGKGLTSTLGGHSRAYYVCGSTFDLVAEAAVKRRDASADLFTFWRALFEEGKPTYEPDHFFRLLDRESGDPSLSLSIRKLLDEAQDDPAHALRDLLARVGIATTLGHGPVPPPYDEMGSIPAASALLPSACVRALEFIGDVASRPKVVADGACPGLSVGDRIEALAGVPLGPLGATAFGRGYASCVARGSVEVTTKRGDHVLLPCASRPSAPPPFFTLDTVP